MEMNMNFALNASRGSSFKNMNESMNSRRIALKKINRHSPFYAKAIKQGKIVRSNRNELLLGESSSKDLENSVYISGIIDDDPDDTN